MSIPFQSKGEKSSVSLCLFLSSRSPAIGHRLGQHRKRQILKSACVSQIGASWPFRNCAACSTSSQNSVSAIFSDQLDTSLPQRIQNIVRGEILVLHNSGEPSRQENNSSRKERLQVWEIVAPRILCVLTSVQQQDSVGQNVVEKGGWGELLSSAQVKQDPTEGGGWVRIDWLGGGGGGSGGAAGVGRWVDGVQPVLNLLQSCFNQHLQMVASQDLSVTEISRTLATKYPTN